MTYRDILNVEYMSEYITRIKLNELCKRTKLTIADMI